MRRAIPLTTSAAIVLMLATATPQVALADGGTLRLSQRSGDLQISVFTSPATLRVGPVDISVLVQDARTGSVRSDLPVNVQLQNADERELILRQQATTASATNKLLQAAQLEVPRAGQWRGQVAADDAPHAEPLQFELTISPPIPAWLELAPWVVWPLGVVLLFGAHQLLVAQRTVAEAVKLQRGS